MTRTPAISVVMSVYNDAERLPRAVESIVRQTFEDWELIVINDGSTDATAEVANQLARSDGRLRVIHQDNSGLTRALIRGCQAATGRYIARQDADDWSHPERFAEQFKLLEEHTHLGFVSCWVSYVGPADEPLEIIRRSADWEIATRELLDKRQGPPAHGSVMFRKSVYQQAGGYREPFYFAQDSDLWLRMAEIAQVGYVGQVLYHFRRSANSISSASRAFQYEFGELGQACRQARQAGRSEAPLLERADRLTRDILVARKPEPASAADAATTDYLIGSQLAKNGDDRGARYLWSVLRHKPWHLKAWIRLVQSRMPRLTLRPKSVVDE